MKNHNKINQQNTKRYFHLRNLILIGVLFGLSITSCKKKDPDPVPDPDTEAPVITRTKPGDGGMYMVDSTGMLMMAIPIQAEITDNHQLVSIDVNLRYVNADSVVMSFQHNPGASAYSLDTTYMNTDSLPVLMDHQDHELIITVRDSTGNSTSDTCAFFIHYMG